LRVQQELTIAGIGVKQRWPICFVPVCIIRLVAPRTVPTRQSRKALNTRMSG